MPEKITDNNEPTPAFTRMKERSQDGSTLKAIAAAADAIKTEPMLP